ncbi:hypothetical protein A8M32_10675 [Sinorhizobium alkalisoli]|uniref:Uncharacterized protein n=1 Tax=Sinorhizobium alkalisoli TaxID=1752398 RepID=A0A1E3VCG2_9HYPH|nr:hypothetical protein A8M32_10675 [Sinorhizobium alkalisoli]
MHPIVTSGSRCIRPASKEGCPLRLRKETLDVAKARFDLDRTRIISVVGGNRRARLAVRRRGG